MGGGAVARVLHRGDAEVGEDDPAGAVEQDVAGLHVTVEHSGAMGRGERVHDLRADAGHLACVEGAALAQDVVQGRSVHQFHDDQRPAVDLRHVVHGDDSRVAHAGRRARLALHAQPQVGQFGRARVRVRTQFLDRDLAAQDLVERPPDDAHSAAAQLGDDAVASDEEPADPVGLVGPVRSVLLPWLLVFPRRHRCPVPESHQ